MATEIIDGVGPQNHVTSDQVGLAQEGTIGAGAIILPVGQQLGYDIVSNNQVNIKDGVYLIQGKRGWIRPGTVEQCTIDTGNNGQYRNDLICVKYTKNAQSKVEEFSVEVVKGTPGAAGTDPTYTTGDINDGALESYAPIYRVRLNGINIIGVDLVASKIDSLLDTAKKIGNLSELTTSAKTSLVAAANELKAAIGELNGKIESAVTINYWFGNLAYPGTSPVIPAVIVAKTYNNHTRADIHIECKFESFENSGSDFDIFSVDALKVVCSCNNINCDTKHTNVILYRLDGETVGTDNHCGRTGLQYHIDNERSYFERVYNNEMTSGGWNRSEKIYKAGNYAIINAYGAVIS